MSRISVKGVQKRNPRDLDAAPKFYLSAVRGRQIGVEEMAEGVAERCSLRKSDVQGVLIALMDLIPKEICNGNVVSLGELGSFYVNVSSTGADTVDDVTTSNLKGFKLIHMPTKKFKKHLRLIDVSLQSAT